MTAQFIFFHGVAINTTNMLAGVIWKDNDDATKSRLYITTEHGGEQHALDVDYDTARDEWARVWTPQHETACACDLSYMGNALAGNHFWRGYPLGEVDVNGKAVKK